MEYKPARRDWTKEEAHEYFDFNYNLETKDPDAVYYGEVITLYNPNIRRNSIEEIPERNVPLIDMTLMANRYQIKQVKPPEDETK